VYHEWNSFKNLHIYNQIAYKEINEAFIITFTHKVMLYTAQKKPE